MTPVEEHGGGTLALARRLGVAPEAVLDLSVSLNPVAPDVAPFVARHAGAVRRYPDADEATSALAAAMGVAPDRLVLTNGGAEAIALLAAELGAGWVDDPDFSLYRRHLPSLSADAPRWRSNPHNPTGLLAPPEERAGVWDEAFFPLSTGRWTRGDPGTPVVGSLTKLYACPGLRLGYALLPTVELADRVRARQPRWAVNGLACAVLPELVALTDLPAWAGAVAERRQRLVDVLRAHALEPLPSDANWVLVPSAGSRVERLASRAILVRDCTSFGLPGTARIAVPDDDGLERLDAALGARPGQVGETAATEGAAHGGA